MTRNRSSHKGRAAVEGINRGESRWEVFVVLGLGFAIGAAIAWDRADTMLGLSMVLIVPAIFLIVYAIYIRQVAKKRAALAEEIQIDHAAALAAQTAARLKAARASGKFDRWNTKYE